MYITLVVPVYNEKDVLHTFYDRIKKILSELPYTFEILFINDGSSDNSMSIIEQLAESDPTISYINLSRNFGKECAMTAGIDYAEADAVIFIDADLQDPPELIPQMIEKWQDGYDAVYARRAKRDTDTPLKRLTALGFYKIIAKLSRFEIPHNTGDYRLISRRSVLALRQLPEKNRFMKGLFAWVGYSQTAIEFDREKRAAGTTKFNYWKLWNFALDGITAFSTLPLRLASYIGGFLASISFFYGLFIIAKTLLFGDPVAGYPSLMVVVLFLGGLQLIFMGILGEYLGRTFDESKNRPLYLIDRYRSCTQTLKNSSPSSVNNYENQPVNEY